MYYPSVSDQKARYQTLSMLCLLLTSVISLPASSTEQYQRDIKYSSLTDINRDNVSSLQPAWEFHTGEEIPTSSNNTLLSFQDQPAMIDGNLVVCSTSRKLFALDPATGEQRWLFDPEDKATRIKKCRGISHWVDDQAQPGDVCQSRIFLGTADYRLFAIDAKTGKACASFGDNGQVIMPTSEPVLFPEEVSALSRPAIVNDVVVVGSSVADNQRVDAPSGRVLAYDARTGKPLWQFDPLPRDPADPAGKTWEKGTAQGFGGGNVWASMAVDEQLDLVYLPTTSPSSDFYGGDRGGDNLYSSSLVALKGSTGEVAWYFQFVHHNVFDYDTPSQPILIDYPVNGEMVPAVVQNTKMGLIYIFNRATGEPLIPIEEVPVPQDVITEGEQLSTTQPIPVDMPVLTPQSFSPDDAWGFTFVDKWLCKRKIESLNYGPIYTPPSEKGTIFFPAMGGGPNWGGGAYDPNSHVMVVASNRVPTVTTLMRRDKVAMASEQAIETVGEMSFDVQGAYFLPKVAPLLSPLGAPCSEPPWAALTAVDLVAKKIIWEVPLGSIEKMAHVPFSWYLGTPGAGGALITAGGVAFIGYTLDDTFRAFDMSSGEILWEADLPAAGTAVPVTYAVNGEQYVVIPAGGHSMYASTLGDSVVAYKLPK
ncbi:pyrroloquinoline quinone-dependent dehydrogenase [Halioxenophilus sp. WMMB6]|uniref:pyrroloquinoline quinone-dependent dehydrogenase n=1 Tax=Halioxenophilus sp. WMMB6 TaxID=3073815 RepID=UPI00295E6057|nr:pyrroloquinoline quinone-dependent dehydrogenase [Halioxenophilus sp. WMMB6]